MNDKDEANIEKATKCHICENTYTKKDIPVRDPCHVTGNYRRSANQDCNLIVSGQLTSSLPPSQH